MEPFNGDLGSGGVVVEKWWIGATGKGNKKKGRNAREKNLKVDLRDHVKDYYTVKQMHFKSPDDIVHSYTSPNVPHHPHSG